MYQTVSYERALKLATEYCLEHNYSPEKLKDAYFFQSSGGSVFAGEPEFEPTPGAGLTEDRRTQYRGFLCVYLDGKVKTTPHIDLFLDKLK